MSSHVAISSLSDFLGKGGSAPSARQQTYNGMANAIGFSRCQSGGDLFSKHTFSGAVTVRFQFAGYEGGFMGYSQDWPGSHYWPIATQSYDGHQRIWLHTDGQWRTYVDKFTCPYSHCRIMLEDWAGSGGSCGNVWFANFQVFSGHSPTVEC